jgi:hypothetical protein
MSRRLIWGLKKAPHIIPLDETIDLLFGFLYNPKTYDKRRKENEKNTIGYFFSLLSNILSGFKRLCLTERAR